MITTVLILMLAGGPEPSVAVMPLSSKTVDPAIVGALDSLLVTKVSQHTKGQVISSADISNMLGLEKMKEAIGCDDLACVAEIGGTLGVDLLFTATVDKVGNNLIFTSTLLDIRTSSPISRQSVEGVADENLYPRYLGDLVARSFGGAPSTLTDGTTAADAESPAAGEPSAVVEEAPPASPTVYPLPSDTVLLSYGQVDSNSRCDLLRADPGVETYPTCFSPDGYRDINAGYLLRTGRNLATRVSVSLLMPYGGDVDNDGSRSGSIGSTGGALRVAELFAFPILRNEGGWPSLGSHWLEVYAGAELALIYTGRINGGYEGFLGLNVFYLWFELGYGGRMFAEKSTGLTSDDARWRDRNPWEAGSTADLQTVFHRTMTFNGGIRFSIDWFKGGLGQ